MRTAKIEAYKGADGDWRWRLRAKNGRIIAHGAEGYRRKGELKRAIIRVVDAMFGPLIVWVED